MHDGGCRGLVDKGGQAGRIRVQADKAFLRDSHRYHGPQKSFCKATEVESSRSIKVLRQRIYEQRENKRRVYVPYRCSHLSS